MRLVALYMCYMPLPLPVRRSHVAGSTVGRWVRQIRLPTGAENELSQCVAVPLTQLNQPHFGDCQAPPPPPRVTSLNLVSTTVAFVQTLTFRFSQRAQRIQGGPKRETVPRYQ